MCAFHGPQIERSGRRPQLLRPFVPLMRCGDVPIKKNQTRTLQVLIQPSLTQPMLLYNLPEQKVVRREIIKVRLRSLLHHTSAPARLVSPVSFGSLNRSGRCSMRFVCVFVVRCRCSECTPMQGRPVTTRSCSTTSC
jgi:hypothetical protein